MYTLQGKIAAHSVSGENGPTGYSVSSLPRGIFTVAIETGAQRSTFRISSLVASGTHAFGLLSATQKPLSKRAATSKDYVLSFSRNNFQPISMTVPAGTQSGLAVKMKSPYPMRNILRLFTDPAIPSTGPAESPASPKGWTSPGSLPDRIGGGPGRHDMIYVGENYRRIVVVVGGKVVWEYDTKNTFELDDIWMLSNGNVLYSHMTYAEEITPKKEVVWHFDCPAGAEIHTLQPIGLDKVLFMLNQQPKSRVRLYNKVTKTFEIDQEMEMLGGATHPQCRRLRATGRGTYVLSSLNNSAAYLLDKDFKQIWKYPTKGGCWSAAALKSGNFLIQDEGQSTAIELDGNGSLVWSCKKTDFTLPAGSAMANTQTCERLSNGNTVIFGNGVSTNNIQAVEVTPAKEAVWFLQDWIDLGDATSAQFLDEPGYPEVPGQTNH